MILAIFPVPLALGTKAEFQKIPILFRAATDGAFMSGHCPLSLPYALVITLPAVNLLGTETAHVPHAKEEQKEISQRDQSHNTVGRMRNNSRLGQPNQHRHGKQVGKEPSQNRYPKIEPVDNSQPLCLDGNEEKQEKGNIRVGGRICKKQREVQIVGSKHHS